MDKRFRQTTNTKVRSDESNDDVTIGLLRPLVPETTSGRNLENHKTFKNSQMAADKRIKHSGHKVLSSRPSFKW
jgi:hypothetical protein